MYDKVLQRAVILEELYNVMFNFLGADILTHAPFLEKADRKRHILWWLGSLSELLIFSTPLKMY